MKGRRRQHARPRPAQVAHVWCCTVVGLAAVSAPTLYLGLSREANVFLIGSFGATAVLLYASPRSDLAQPRNLFGGHVISALVGVTFHHMMSTRVEIAAALAVAAAIAAMQLTHTLHPPGGATCLIAVIGGPSIYDLGYRYVLTPVLAGVAVMFAVAVLLNNLSAEESRHYPASWW